MKAMAAFSVVRAAGRIGFRTVMAEKFALLGGFGFYAALVISYGGVFRWVPRDNLSALGLTYEELVWYLGFTEIVLFSSVSFHFKELQYEIQSDQIHLALIRPAPAWLVRLSDWGGQFVARFTLQIIPALALLTWVTGGVHPRLLPFLGFLLSLPGAALILLSFYSLVGSTCLWVKQAEPVFWVWQKINFLLGALLWPFALYPVWFAKAARLLPFASILATPGQWVLGGDGVRLAESFALQIFWAVALVYLVSRMDRAVLKRIQASGA